MNNKDIKKVWEYKKRKCVIIWVHSHFCAYVETKLKNISYSEKFGESFTSPEYNIDCHGGVTFSGEIKELKDDKWYFGMDFAHYGDYVDMSYVAPNFSSMEDGHRWTLEEVQYETERMCNSVLKYEKKYPKYKRLYKKFQKELEDLKNEN